MQSELTHILQEPEPLLAFLRLEEFYRLADADQQAAIRSGWDYQRKWRIPGLDYSDHDRIVFRPLLGEDANGLDAEAMIEAHLTYHGIENARSDFRDTGLDLCLCYHSALYADLDVAQLFEEAATISDANMAARMRGWLKSEPENRSRWAMGFRSQLIENGVAYEWIGTREDYELLKPKQLDAWGRSLDNG